ncbi:MAG TPA: efflux RND transporter periplasmic adaptor subunit [Candidatus Paceibacterota bacterium]|nr:efflux RND transporter periplasmic adaptor subunit [Verrucomicrobiota bacterium]HSA09972.1 efflux RND transporter periplasmic adaptor subunit [Candidatus Paceibacterota bacterium]
MVRKISIAVLLVVLVVGTLAGIKALQVARLMAAGKSFSPPPETVSSAVVHEEKWQGTLTAIGSVTAAQGVTVTPEIPGIVREIAFDSGAVVAKDDLLLRLDTSEEEARLRALQAQEELARINLARERSLREQNMVSQSELDSAEATLKQTRGNADTIRATIEKKTIRAPFAGRSGIRLVNLGQYLEAGAPIVSLQSLRPVYADFSLPQQDLARLKPGMRVRVTTDAYPGRDFDGTLTAINPDLDQQTRSVGLRAAFDNADQLLRPGMFVRAEVLLPEARAVVAIPATSVLSAPFGDSVYVIEPKPGNTNSKPELVVRQQFIRTGRARGDFVSVESGLKPGQRIVSSGIFKLRNGMAVIENNSLAPKADLAPQPADS